MGILRRKPSDRSSSSSLTELSELKPRSSDKMVPVLLPPFVIRATAIASLGGILFGYDMGVISGALPQLTTTFSLTTHQQEVVVGILYLGGGLGAAVGGSLCDSLGRKTAILVTDIIFVVGAAILYFAESVQHIIIGRVVVGFAISVSGIADVAYLHEIAPLEWRGAIVSVNEACISLGFLLAYLAGYLLSTIDPSSGWRTMFGLSGVLALLQLAGMYHMPESPVWLNEQGRTEESEQALRLILGEGGDRSAEQNGTQSLPTQTTSGQLLAPSVQSYESLTAKNTSPSSSPSRTSSYDYISHSYQQVTKVIGAYRKQVWIALFLSVAQQFTGQANVLNYAPLIFSQFQESSLSATLWIGLVKFLTTVIVIWKIEDVGRRFLLLTGMGFVVLGLLMVSIAFSTGIAVDENGEAIPSGGGMYWALPGVLLVVFGYSVSFGPLTWLLTSELFPTEIRGRALGTSTIVTYLCASLVTSTFLSAQVWLGASRLFLVYAAVTFAGIVFAFLAIPDTGGKTVQDTDDALKRMWWWRPHSNNYFQDIDTERPALEAELT